MAEIGSKDGMKPRKDFFSRLTQLGWWTLCSNPFLQYKPNFVHYRPYLGSNTARAPVSCAIDGLENMVVDYPWKNIYDLDDQRSKLRSDLAFVFLRVCFV